MGIEEEVMEEEEVATSEESDSEESDYEEAKKPKKTGNSVPTGACQRQPRGGVFMLSNLTKYCLAIAASCASEG